LTEGGFDAQYEENAALRALARQMAEVSDSATLLRLLAETASAQCRADGALVEQLAPGGLVEVVATAGHLRGSHGVRFPLSGSLTERAVVERAAVAEPDYAHSKWRSSTGPSGDGIGPVLLVPLIAHETMLGVLSVVRRLGASMFSRREQERLEVIADFASLALWKSHLFEQAQAASRAKSEFIATVSHELRTPLTALTGYGELLADGILGPMRKEQHEIVDRMRSVTHHLTGMIDEILTYASLEAGRELVHCRDVAAAEPTRAAEAVVEPLARQKGIGFGIEVPLELRLCTDADKVRQILVNLLSNAVKFTERGEVRLVAREAAAAAGPTVRFTVSDTGIGISSENLRRLFQPFTQLDSSLTRKYPGTGLGLYISNRLAALLGGTIEVASELGVGRRFTLVLPAGRDG
jgi:signal transduction histidine kinase